MNLKNLFNHLLNTLENAWQNQLKNQVLKLKILISLNWLERLPVYLSVCNKLEKCLEKNHPELWTQLIASLEVALYKLLCLVQTSKLLTLKLRNTINNQFLLLINLMEVINVSLRNYLRKEVPIHPLKVLLLRKKLGNVNLMVHYSD